MAPNVGQFKRIKPYPFAYYNIRVYILLAGSYKIWISIIVSDEYDKMLKAAAVNIFIFL